MSDNGNKPQEPTPETRRETWRFILMSQFTFYRRLVAKKHSFNVWLELDPNALTDAELEQVVAFLKDAAHLPPG